MAESNEEWELSKENIRPIQQGRKQKVLKVALASHPEDVVLQQRQCFENELRTYSGDDPLSVWCKYINWVEQNYPKGGREGHIKELLEHCLSILKEETKYFDDDRFVDIMIRYANLSGKPIEVYNYMYNGNIGCKSAKFFISWSWELEQLGNFKKADEVLTQGLQRRAEPIEKIQSYLKDFEIRFTNRIKGNLETENIDTNNSRSAFSVLKPQKKNFAPVMRTGDALIENKMPLVLGRQQPQPKSNKSSAKVPFKIYNSENINPSRPVQSQSAIRCNFTSENSKENEQRPSKWNKVKVKSKSLSDGNPDFQFHCDEENDQQIRTPRSVPKTSNILSARRRTPSPPIALFEPPDPLKIPRYPKNKVYGGANEYSLEEIRAAEWLENEKKVEMERLLKEKIKSEEQLKKEVKYLAKKLELLESHLTAGSPSNPPSTSMTDNETDSSKNVKAECNKFMKNISNDEEKPVVQGHKNNASIHSFQSFSDFKHNQQHSLSEADDKCNDSTNYFRAENLMQDLYNGTLSNATDEDESKSLNVANQIIQSRSILKEGNEKSPFTLYHDMTESIPDLKKVACPKTSVKENCPSNLSTVKQLGQSSAQKLPFTFYQDPTETTAARQSSDLENILKEPREPFAIYCDPTKKIPNSQAVKQVSNLDNKCKVTDNELSSLNHDPIEKINNSSKILSSREVTNKQHCFSDIIKVNQIINESNVQLPFTLFCDSATEKSLNSNKDISFKGLEKKQYYITDLNEKNQISETHSSLKEGNENLLFALKKDVTAEVIPNSDEAISVRVDARTTNPQKVVADEESSDEDIENIPPNGYVQETMKRELAGILEPSKNILFIPLEQQELDENSDVEDDFVYQNRIQYADETLIPPSNTEQFSTAKFFASTPYGLKSSCSKNSGPQDETLEKYGLQDPCLPPRYLDTTKESFTGGENAMISTEVKSTAEPVFNTDVKSTCYSRLPNILSVILETSSENYKSSSSSSSASLTKSNHLDQYSAQHFSLRKNQSKFEAIEPSNLSSVSEVSNHISDECVENVAQRANREENKIQRFLVDFDPFDPKETENLLKSIDISNYNDFFYVGKSIRAVKVGETICIGDLVYLIESEIAEGAYAKVYKCKETHKGSSNVASKALKVCKKANEWEFYVCSEVQRRLIENKFLPNIKNSVINIMSALKYSDGIVLINEYSDLGTLLDVVNYYKKQNFSMPEVIVMYFTLEILHIISKVHKCNIIHGDIKPDNFLLMDTTFDDIFEKMGDSTSLKLIDFGRAVDLNLYDKGICFTATLAKNYFKCNEMKENKPWVFQLDWYGVLSCIHTMLFSEYMTVKKNKNGVWEIGKKFKRYWFTALWEPLFNELLNIPECYEEPDVSKFISMIESKLKENMSSFAMHLNRFSKGYSERQ